MFEFMLKCGELEIYIDFELDNGLSVIFHVE